MTLRELIIEWLKIYQGDACDPDLTQMVKAGHVKLRGRDRFIQFSDYRVGVR